MFLNQILLDNQKFLFEKKYKIIPGKCEQLRSATSIRRGNVHEDKQGRGIHLDREKRCDWIRTRVHSRASPGDGHLARLFVG